ncbi:MAG: 4-hydroxy-tetrahydrodipicolinate synthase [Parachlamydiaceae bacterium]
MKAGVYTAIITPFLEDHSLDIEGLRENLRFQVESGVAGIVILGTTGEVPTLEEPEKELIIKTAVEEIQQKVPLIVGTGSYSTKKTLIETKKAKDLGADAALVVTPYYNRPTQEGLYQHFKEIAKLDFPLILYNIQGRTGQNLQTETLMRLLEFPAIVAIKEASGNISQIMDVIYQTTSARPKFKVFSGDDALTLPLIALGGHGVISVMSNLLPDAMNELVQHCLKHQWIEARAWQHELFELFKLTFIETNPIPIKRMMQRCDMAAGPCRLPLCNLSSKNDEKLTKIIPKLKILISAAHHG